MTSDPPATADLPKPDGGKPETLTIVLGGDLGLGGSNQPVRPDGAMRHGARTPWAELTAGIAPLLEGDVVFANLETVVTARNNIGAARKAFNFRSHPDGVRHLVDLGLNVFSTANNHAIDYGEAGMRDTLANLEALAEAGLEAWPGVGLGREAASAPGVVAANGARVLVSALGIGGNGAPPTPAGRAPRPAMMSYHAAKDYSETVARLAEADGDLRILSVHYNRELQVRPSATDVRKLRDETVRAAGIDIVAGHHAHVVAGVQMVDDRALVFYGLGNLLHPGMQNMARFSICRDYGLVARVHLARTSDGRYAPLAVEAIPLTDMHHKAKPLGGEEGRTRVRVLNHLAEGLDDPQAGATGVRFTPRPDGTGLYCQPGAGDRTDHIGTLCRNWQPPEPPDAAMARRLVNACGGSGRSDRVAGSERRRPVRQKSEPSWSFFNW